MNWGLVLGLLAHGLVQILLQILGSGMCYSLRGWGMMHACDQGKA